MVVHIFMLSVVETDGIALWLRVCVAIGLIAHTGRVGHVYGTR